MPLSWNGKPTVFIISEIFIFGECVGLRGKAECHEAPNKSSHRHKYHQNVPEPENDEDFLVDDIQRHDTECIVALYRSRRTVLEKIAFGNFRKNDVESVHAASEIVANEIQAQPIELAAEKSIGEINLQHQIDHIQNFGENQTFGKHLVDSYVFVKFIFDDKHAAIDCMLTGDHVVATETYLISFLIVLAQSDHLQTFDQCLDATT